MHVQWYRSSTAGAVGPLERSALEVIAKCGKCQTDQLKLERAVQVPSKLKHELQEPVLKTLNGTSYIVFPERFRVAVNGYQESFVPPPDDLGANGFWNLALYDWHFKASQFNSSNINSYMWVCPPQPIDCILRLVLHWARQIHFQGNYLKIHEIDT